MPDEFWPEEAKASPDWETWDPVTLAEYLVSLEAVEPDSDLVLEIRRHVLNADGISLDIRRRAVVHER